MINETFQPAPRVPACQRTPGLCASAPLWSRAGWCRCGCRAGLRSLLWHDPLHPEDPWSDPSNITRVKMIISDLQCEKFVIYVNILVQTWTSKPVDEDFLQTSVDKVGHQRAVVSADRLDAFTVHLVVCVCTWGKIQPCVALLINQQVRVIHLWRSESQIILNWAASVCIRCQILQHVWGIFCYVLANTDKTLLYYLNSNLYNNLWNIL